jgi:hypothetical protein
MNTEQQTTYSSIHTISDSADGIKGSAKLGTE